MKELKDYLKKLSKAISKTNLSSIELFSMSKYNKVLDRDGLFREVIKEIDQSIQSRVASGDTHVILELKDQYSLFYDEIKKYYESRNLKFLDLEIELGYKIKYFILDWSNK